MALLEIFLVQCIQLTKNEHLLVSESGITMDSGVKEALYPISFLAFTMIKY